MSSKKAPLNEGKETIINTWPPYSALLTANAPKAGGDLCEHPDHRSAELFPNDFSTLSHF